MSSKQRRTLGLVCPEERRHVERTGSERVDGRLKDEFGGRHVRVRGYDKVLAHLVFGMTVLAASQPMRLLVPPIRSGSSLSSSPQPLFLRGRAAKRALDRKVRRQALHFEQEGLRAGAHGTVSEASRSRFVSRVGCENVKSPARWHAAKRPSATARSSGCSARQRCTA